MYVPLWNNGTLNILILTEIIYCDTCVNYGETCVELKGTWINSGTESVRLHVMTLVFFPTVTHVSSHAK